MLIVYKIELYTTSEPKTSNLSCRWVIYKHITHKNKNNLLCMRILKLGLQWSQNKWRLHIKLKIIKLRSKMFCMDTYTDYYLYNSVIDAA